MTETRKTIVLFCASTSGLVFLRKLLEIRPKDLLIVLSFREDEWEPAFFDDIRELTLSTGNEFHEARAIGPVTWEKILRGRPVHLIFAVGWRYLVPHSVYQGTLNGSVVFHDSLLPKYRGFAPTNWAIINGESETGATMFLMSETVDSGPIIDQVSVGIGPEQTIGEVSTNVTQAYLTLLENNLEDLLSGSYATRPQDSSKATLTTKRVPNDGEINWLHKSDDIHNLIRALSRPWPGAFTTLSGRKLMIWSAKRYYGPSIIGSIPGRVVDFSNRPMVTIATGDGALLVESVQLENGPIAKASEIIKSVSDTLGR